MKDCAKYNFSCTMVQVPNCVSQSASAAIRRVSEHFEAIEQLLRAEAIRSTAAARTSLQTKSKQPKNSSRSKTSIQSKTKTSHCNQNLTKYHHYKQNPNNLKTQNGSPKIIIESLSFVSLFKHLSIIFTQFGEV